ncbi:630_t:CDS:2, partial [Scutellospora calospora]
MDYEDEPTEKLEIEVEKGVEQEISESILFKQYAAVSRDESFMVVFDINDVKDPILKLYEINFDKKYEKYKTISGSYTERLIFENEQYALMESKDFSSLTVAVSDELTFKETKFRVVAISCISHKDMYKDHDGENGFTKLWTIEYKSETNDYEARDCSLDIEHGGIIQFLSEITTEYTQFTLILLRESGIYKYHYSLRHSYYYFFKSFLRDEMLALEYSERIVYALRYNCIDTSERDLNKNIELYNLKTNQLMNVFQRHKSTLPFLNSEKPGAFAVSNDERLLAYVSGNNIKIYLIENGLELSSMTSRDSMYNIEFMNTVRDSIGFQSLDKAT